MWCIIVYVSRTNIDLDDRLVEMAMQRYGLRTKKEAVDLALRRLVGGVMTREEALAMEGFGWDGDLAEIGGVVVIEEWD
jgi:Arc/MetJ family transcription regulator